MTISVGRVFFSSSEAKANSPSTIAAVRHEAATIEARMLGRRTRKMIVHSEAPMLRDAS